MIYKLREGRPGDINGLMLRECDLLELKECCLKSPEDQIRESWESSDIRWTVTVNDEVACVFGCCGMKGKFGVPWLLGTDLTKMIKKAFLREIKTCCGIMLRDYKYLINYVHTENKQSIRWLKWLGFDIKEPVPFGEFGALFHPFTMEKNV